MDLTVPSSLVGAIVFFLLLGIIAAVVIRETVRALIKPALVIVGLVLVATWTGILDSTLVGRTFASIGDRLVAGVEGVSEWVAETWESRSKTSATE